jgi:hypothetical protein
MNNSRHYVLNTLSTWGKRSRWAIAAVALSALVACGGGGGGAGGTGGISSPDPSTIPAGASITTTLNAQQLGLTLAGIATVTLDQADAAGAPQVTITKDQDALSATIFQTSKQTWKFCLDLIMK